MPLSDGEKRDLRLALQKMNRCVIDVCTFGTLGFVLGVGFLSKGYTAGPMPLVATLLALTTALYRGYGVFQWRSHILDLVGLMVDNARLEGEHSVLFAYARHVPPTSPPARSRPDFELLDGGREDGPGKAS